jgi:ParB-like chromosome segregation protein Spo0J
MKIETLPTETLIPYARNSRTHSDEQIAQIMASIREFGFCNPVLVDAENGIIAGHGRVMAAQRMQLKEVPCIRLGHLTEAQKRAYVIADNRIALNSTWDDEMLSLEIQELHSEDYDVGSLGFSPEELTKLLEIEDLIPPSEAREINVDGFAMQCECPRCHFEFDPKA